MYVVDVSTLENLILRFLFVNQQRIKIKLLTDLKTFLILSINKLNDEFFPKLFLHWLTQVLNNLKASRLYRNPLWIIIPYSKIKQSTESEIFLERVVVVMIDVPQWKGEGLRTWERSGDRHATPSTHPPSKTFTTSALTNHRQKSEILMQYKPRRD